VCAPKPRRRTRRLQSKVLPSGEIASGNLMMEKSADYEQ
jgi:hypothetical protein